MGTILPTCPGCEKILEDMKHCRFCGAECRVNPVSGRMIWMRAGRVVAAPQDSKEAWIRMAKAFGVPEDQWPEQFRS